MVQVGYLTFSLLKCYIGRSQKVREIRERIVPHARHWILFIYPKHRAVKGLFSFPTPDIGRCSSILSTMLRVDGQHPMSCIVTSILD